VILNLGNPRFLLGIKKRYKFTFNINWGRHLIEDIQNKIESKRRGWTEGVTF
jgi:hypothetical protein